MEVKEPAVAYHKRKYSIEEYLQLEYDSEDKHEYYQGEIFAMAGNKTPHIVVAGNIHGLLWNKLDGKPCQPYNGERRIYIEKNSLFTYPDISVICGDVISLNNDDLNILNPTAIFEILSLSTKDYDKKTKFKLYQDIPTLKEYILVEPELVYIETFHINKSGFWESRQYIDINETLKLNSIKVSLRLKDIYKRTKLVS
jgi:Uma2 family endonuclease